MRGGRERRGRRGGGEEAPGRHRRRRAGTGPVRPKHIPNGWAGAPAVRVVFGMLSWNEMAVRGILE